MGLFEQKMAEKLKLAQAEPTQEEKQMPSITQTRSDKVLSPQFDGFLLTIGSTGKEILDKLHEYKLALARGEKDTELEKKVLTENQHKMLTEKHREFYETKKQIDTAKTIIRDEKFFHSLLREPEILNDPGFAGLKSPEQVTDLLDIYFQKAFESGDKAKLDQVKELIKNVMILKDERTKGVEINSKLAAITQKEGITDDKMLEAADKSYIIIPDPKDLSKTIKTFDRAKLQEQITTTREKMINRFKLDQSWIMGKYFKKRISEITHKVNTAGEAKQWLEQIDKTREDVKTNLLINLKNPTFTIILDAELVGDRAKVSEPAGPTQNEMFNFTEKMVKQGIIPDDETFDAQKFESYFGQPAPDFSEVGAEAKLAKIFATRGIDAKSPGSENYLTMLFGKMRENFGKNEVKNENQEFVKTIEPQAIKTAEILKNLNLTNAAKDFETGGEFYKPPAKTNAERKAIIVKNINKAQEKITKNVESKLKTAFGFDAKDNSLLINMLTEKVLSDKSLAKPDALSSENISAHLAYTKKLVDNVAKINWEDQKNVLTDLKTKAEELNKLEEENNKKEDTAPEKNKIKAAIFALDRLRKAVIKGNKPKDFETQEKTFNDIIADTDFPADAKAKFEDFRNKFKEAKDKMVEIAEEKIMEKQEAGKKTSAVNLPAGAI